MHQEKHTRTHCLRHLSTPKSASNSSWHWHERASEANSILHCCTALIYTSECTLNSASQFTNISCRRICDWRAQHGAFKWHILCVCVDQQHSCHFNSPNIFMNKDQNSEKKNKKQNWWLHRGTENRYETKLPQTWPNKKAETLCRGRLGWSGLFIGSLWGLLTENAHLFNSYGYNQRAGCESENRQRGNILYITSKTYS